MKINIKIFLLCPIPDDQKPINEYLNLKNNNFTNFILLSPKNYLLKIIFNFVLFFVLVTPLTFLLKLNNYIFLFNSFFSINLLTLLFLTNYSRWSQLLKRFRNSRLFYEEGSWYDGQYWEKPFEIIKNDKLITNQKIKPILKRIIKTIVILFLFNLYIYFNFIFNL
jgi:hypothetical protein